MSELSRKRPHADDGDLSISKKRAITGTNGTPQVNGHPDQTEDELLFHANLEKFRKEAIYRRMKHYHRENERYLERIEELERRKTTCEAGLVAISACWAQLIETIRLFVKSDDVSLKAEDVFNVAAHVDEDSLPELSNALNNTANATEALFNKLIEAGGADKAIVWKQNYFQELQNSKSQCKALKAETVVLRQELDDCKSQKDKYYNDLLAAESRAERAQSESWKLMHPEKRPPKSASTPNEGEATATSSDATSTTMEDAERKPSSPSASAPAAQPQDFTVLPEVAQIWEQKIALLEQEKTALQRELLSRGDKLTIAAHPPNKFEVGELKRHMGQLEIDLKQARDEIVAYRQSRVEWEEAIKDTQVGTIDSYKTAIGKRDSEIHRLREQRDQANAERLERKERESYKWNSLQEFKNLCESLSQRISGLKSELSRCKARLAAQEGHGDLMQFFLKGNPDELALIKELRKEKEEALIRARAAETALSKLIGSDAQTASSSSSSSSPDPSLSPERAATLVKEHAEAEAKVLRLTQELESLKKVYGEGNLALPPDVEKLTQQIRSQAQELEKLRFLQQQHEAEQAPLYAEMDKLSADWDALEKQVSDKVYDLHHLEDKLAKMIVEKAKSDNKFFAAMRDKEALEVERKALMKVEEKQSAMIKNMDLALQEKENVIKMAHEELALKDKAKEHLQITMTNKEGEYASIKSERDQANWRANHQMEGFNRERAGMLAAEEAMRKKEASWATEKKALEEQLRHAKQQASAKNHSKDRHGENSEYQLMRSLLLCSTCESNFRAVIITKCMHTFCKNCIDQRIATRQRKCPACNMSFAQSDVSTLYMQ